LIDVNRLDQTLGKPSIWMVSNEREKQRMTVVSRLSRVELQVSLLTIIIINFIHRKKTFDSNIENSKQHKPRAYIILLALIQLHLSTCIILPIRLNLM